MLLALATAIRRADTPLTANVKAFAKRILAFEVPAPRMPFRLLYWLHTLIVRAWEHATRVFYFQPLFRARAAHVGESLFLYQGIPYVAGDLHIRIGDHCKISGATTFVAGHVCERPELILGHHTNIGPGVVISASKRVQLGNHVRIGTGVRISDNHGHPLDAHRRRHEPVQANDVAPVVIGDDAWLGSGVIVLPGVTVGKGAVIGAGSVVTKDVPPHSVAVGNPARVKRRLDDGRLPPCTSQASSS